MFRRSCHDVTLVPGRRRLMEGALDEGESLPSVQLSQCLTSMMHDTFTQLPLSVSNLPSVFAQAGHQLHSSASHSLLLLRKSVCVLFPDAHRYIPTRSVMSKTTGRTTAGVRFPNWSTAMSGLRRSLFNIQWSERKWTRGEDGNRVTSKSNQRHTFAEKNIPQGKGEVSIQGQAGRFYLHSKTCHGKSWEVSVQRFTWGGGSGCIWKSAQRDGVRVGEKKIGM